MDANLSKLYKHQKRSQAKQPNPVIVNQISVKHMLTYFKSVIYEACKLRVKRPDEKVCTIKYSWEYIGPMTKWNWTLRLATRAPAHVERCGSNLTAEKDTNIHPKKKRTHSTLKQQNMLENKRASTKWGTKSQKQNQERCEQIKWKRKENEWSEREKKREWGREGKKKRTKQITVRRGKTWK